MAQTRNTSIAREFRMRGRARSPRLAGADNPEMRMATPRATNAAETTASGRAMRSSRSAA
ncbi:hypothetical protein HR12_36435 [Microbacterium sp. SUBG005]|nr:hypothetical protein HR12_36435 [Microbacterium sp. SUBG005]